MNYRVALTRLKRTDDGEEGEIDDDEKDLHLSLKAGQYCEARADLINAIQGCTISVAINRVNTIDIELEKDEDALRDEKQKRQEEERKKRKRRPQKRKKRKLDLKKRMANRLKELLHDISLQEKDLEERKTAKTKSAELLKKEQKKAV